MRRKELVIDILFKPEPRTTTAAYLDSKRQGYDSASIAKKKHSQNKNIQNKEKQSTVILHNERLRACYPEKSNYASSSKILIPAVWLK